MMGDGAEEQNLDERGNPSARIEEDELDAAFGNQKNQRSSKPHHPFWEGGEWRGFAASLVAVRLSRVSSRLRFNLWLIVQNHVQQGTVNLDMAVVINKAQFTKFVHEKTHARSRRADHLRQCPLADFC
jgi:hypothetical protein